MFGKSNRRNNDFGGSMYDLRIFQTTDARQYALDDYHVITTSQSGLAGLVPLWPVDAVELPSGFDFMTNLTALGGSPSPVSNNPVQPLIANPDIARIFISETTGLPEF